MLDGFKELEHLGSCGLVSSGLWINRWSKAKDDGASASMLLCERLEQATYKQDYRPASLEVVLAALDAADLLYLPDGNPYTLLDALRTGVGAKVWAHAKARIDSGDLVLLTASAGTVVAGHTVDVSAERPDGWEGDPTGLCVSPAPLPARRAQL